MPRVLALALLLGCKPTAPEPAGERGSIQLILNHPKQFDRPRDACDTEHCAALLELIEGAQDTLDFAVYGMRNQTALFDALLAAKERGVKIRGVVDRDLDGSNIYAGTDALVDALGNIKDDLHADQRLARQKKRDEYFREPKCDRPAGFEGPLQCLAYDLETECLLAAHASREPIENKAAIMHNKFVVADQHLVWTGSTNLSDSGTGGYNANLVTVLDSTAVAGWYTAEFEQMYKKGQFHTLKEPAGERRAQLGEAKVHVLFSPQDTPVRNAIRPILKEAKMRIDIGVFFLTNKFVTEDLIAAHRRGVKIRIIIDATAAKNGYTKHELLRAAGIPVKVENWGGKMHMKSAMVDNETVITGSMNWTSAGEYENDENTIIVRSPKLAAQYGDYFSRIWKTIPDKWLTANPDPESHDSTTACTDGSDNDFDELKDDADPGCSAEPPPLPELPPWRIVPKSRPAHVRDGDVG